MKKKKLTRIIFLAVSIVLVLASVAVYCIDPTAILLKDAMVNKYFCYVANSSYYNVRTDIFSLYEHGGVSDEQIDYLNNIDAQYFISYFHPNIYYSIVSEASSSGRASFPERIDGDSIYNVDNMLIEVPNVNNVEVLYGEFPDDYNKVALDRRMAEILLRHVNENTSNNYQSIEQLIDYKITLHYTAPSKSNPIDLKVSCIIENITNDKNNVRYTYYKNGFSDYHGRSEMYKTAVLLPIQENYEIFKALRRNYYTTKYHDKRELVLIISNLKYYYTFFHNLKVFAIIADATAGIIMLTLLKRYLKEKKNNKDIKS